MNRLWLRAANNLRRRAIRCMDTGRMDESARYMDEWFECWNEIFRRLA
jgi:hypothetical protein